MPMNAAITIPMLLKTANPVNMRIIAVVSILAPLAILMTMIYY